MNAATASSTTPAAGPFVTFTLDGRSFGVPVEQVRETLAASALTRVPLAPPALVGLLHLRGVVVTAFDLRQFLNLPACPRTAAAAHVVVDTPAGPISLLVDALGDVVHVDGIPFEPMPGDAAPVAGVYAQPEGLLIVLDITRLPAASPDGRPPAA